MYQEISIHTVSVIRLWLNLKMYNQSQITTIVKADITRVYHSAMP